VTAGEETRASALVSINPDLIVCSRQLPQDRIQSSAAAAVAVASRVGHVIIITSNSSAARFVRRYFLDTIQLFHKNAKRSKLQGRSQKFALGGYKSFFVGGLKLLNSRSGVIFTP